MLKKLFLPVLLLSTAAPLAFAFSLSNFETPESFVIDPEDGSYYVSNINGGLLDKDGNGYISKISPGGNLVIQKFIGGKKDEAVLNAPKGLLVLGKNVWVSDIDSVKLFEKATGKLSRNIDFTRFGAKFLNDIADDGRGVVYVSDLITNRIFRVDTNNDYYTDVFLESPALHNPNGLRVNPKTRNLMVVTWAGGEILEIDRAGGIHILKKGLSTLDGIDYDSYGNLYVSNFEKGEIYKITHLGRGTIMTFLSGLDSPADISCDRANDAVLIPSFKGNQVSIAPIQRK